jgi:putative transcription factor
MQCEMCGQDVPVCKKAKVEGLVMQVCSNCMRFGDEVAQKTSGKAVTPAVVSQRLERRENRPVFRDVFETQDTGDSMVPDFARKITQARNAKRMTKNEFAIRINEKLSVVHKLERGELNPDDKLMKKLERELGISLKEKIADVKVEKRAYNQGLTLADFIKKEK